LPESWEFYDGRGPGYSNNGEEGFLGERFNNEGQPYMTASISQKKDRGEGAR